MTVLRILLAAVLLQAATPQSRSALLEGRVVGPEGSPLSKVAVTLQPVNASLKPTITAAPQRTDVRTIISNDDGTFSFDKLRPGIYKLGASRAGFSKSEFGQKGPNGPGTPITISTDQKLRNIILTITPLGAVTGRIQNRDGLPVVRATVQALKFFYHGPLQGQTLAAVQTVTTDENGEYRLFWLQPGSYLIGTIPNSGLVITLTSTLGQTTASVVLPATSPNAGAPLRKPRPDGTFEEEIEVPSFYPGTANSNEATRVVVRAGETVGGIDFEQRFAPSHRIHGEIGPLIPDSPIPLSIQLLPRKSTVELRTIFRTLETGAFEISGVVAGEYLLNGVPIVVGDSDVGNLRFRPVAELISVEGKVTLEAGVAGEPGSNIANRLIFVPLTYNSPAPLFLQPGGSFRANLAVGDYLLLIDGDPANSDRYLKSVRFGNQDGLDVIHISGKPESPMEIVMSSAKGSIDVRVLDERRQPLSNATAVLIPNPPYRHRTDRYLTSTADAMGRFHFNAAPGDYKVFAWEDIETGAWLDPDFILKQEGRGQPVSIREGSQDAIDVTVIPYVP